MEIVQQFLKVVERRTVYSQVEISIEYTLATYAASLLIGLALGLAFGSSSFAKQIAEPYLVLFNAIPKTLFLPVFYLLLGAAFRYEFWFGFVSAVIPMTLNMMFSVATVPATLVGAARSMGASTRAVYFRVVIPSVVPTLLATARIVFSATFAGILLSEEFVGTTGFGYLVIDYTGAFAIVPLYVVVTIASIVGISSYLILLSLERHFSKWARRSI